MRDLSWGVTIGSRRLRVKPSTAGWTFYDISGTELGWVRGAACSPFVLHQHGGGVPRYVGADQMTAALQTAGVI